MQQRRSLVGFRLDVPIGDGYLHRGQLRRCKLADDGRWRAFDFTESRVWGCKVQVCSCGVSGLRGVIHVSTWKAHRAQKAHSARIALAALFRLFALFALCALFALSALVCGAFGVDTWMTPDFQSTLQKKHENVASFSLYSCLRAKQNSRQFFGSLLFIAIRTPAFFHTLLSPFDF